MTNRFLFSTLITLVFCLSLFSQSSSKGRLEITFTELRSDKGKIAIGINTSPEGWPRKPQIELNWKKEDLVDGTFTVEVAELPYGLIAISALDDENSNLEMDTQLGIPREGFGFSNDAPVGLSPPRFKDSSFRFSSSGQQITIRIRYMGKGK